MPEIHRFFATAAKGIEETLAAELTSLGIKNPKAERGGVAFEGPLEHAYRACLWSRTANRILLPIDTFDAGTPEMLYGKCRSIRWADHMNADDTIAVDFTSTRSAIQHTHFGALKVKDAIVDKFRDQTGKRPSVDTFRPKLRINVHLVDNKATVSLDLSGDSLHKRGYREDGSLAPLKENLAAAILLQTDLVERLKGEGPQARFAFLDPMCGSGTLPIEAALIATDTAPGLLRDYFGFLGWQGHVPSIWKRLLEEAKERSAAGKARKLPRIVGYDRDFRAVRVALTNVEKAGMRGVVHIEKREFGTYDAPETKGVIVINPPYGERLGEQEELLPLYKQIGDTFKQKFKGWSGYVFTGNLELAKRVGLKAARRIVFFNGAIECRLLKYELY